MANELPSVQIQLVASGVNEVKQALKTVEGAIKQHYIQTAKYAVKAANDTQKSYDKLYSNLDKQSNNNKDKQLQIQKALNDRLLSQEKELTRKLQQEYKQRGSSFRDSLGKLGRSGISAGSGVRVGGGANRNQMAGALGTIFGIGGGAGVLGRTVQGASAGFGVGGAVGGALGGAAALAAASVQKAFDVLISGIKFGAEAFFGAITQLGGGFNVSDAIAKFHTNQRKAVEISAGTAFLDQKDQITSKQALSIASGISKGTEFDNETVLKAMQVYQAKTGDINSFKENASFITQGASTFGGGDLVAFAGQLANTKAQFSNLSGSDLTRVALGQIKQGQKGSVEFKDQASLATITGAAGSQTGDLVKNILFQTGLAQIAAPASGSIDEGATTIRSYNTAISKLAMGKGKYAAGKAKLGLKTDANGKIENYADVLKRAVLMKPGEVPEAISGEVRAQTFVQGIRNRITGDTDEERSASYDKLIKEFADVALSVEQFNKATKETADTVDYRLKVAFNSLKELIGLKVAPSITRFADYLKENGKAVESAIKVVIDYFTILGQAIGEFVRQHLLPYITEQANDKVKDQESAVNGAQGDYDRAKGRRLQYEQFPQNKQDPKRLAFLEKEEEVAAEKLNHEKELLKDFTELANNLNKALERSKMTKSEAALFDANEQVDEDLARINGPDGKGKKAIEDEINKITSNIGPRTAEEQQKLDQLTEVLKRINEPKETDLDKATIDKLNIALDKVSAIIDKKIGP